MTRNGLAIASSLLVAALSATALLVGSELPADARLPIHWGIDGRPDRFDDKWTALLMPPLIAAAASLLFYFLPSLEPRRKGLERSQGLYLWGWAALLVMFAAIELVVVATALNWPLPVNKLVVGALGLVFILIGNQLGKSRSMFFVGIRTPWTLSSEEVWVKTHRLAGKLMVLAGLAMLLASLLSVPAEVLPFVTLGSLGIAVLVPVVYSFLLWRRQGRAATGPQD